MCVTKVLFFSEMEPWQKVLLLTSYPALRERLEPLTLVDDMVVLGIIEPTHRESLQRLNRHERTGWLIWHCVQINGTKECYNSLMKILQQNEQKIFKELMKKEEFLMDGKCWFKQIYYIDIILHSTWNV